MKKLRCIGYKQTFDVYPFRFKFLRKLFKPTSGWVVRGLHYFYVEEDADIEEVYLGRYNVKKNSVTTGWGNWGRWSDNVSVIMPEGCLANIKVSIVEYGVLETPTMEELWKDMSADDFKSWFHNK